MQILGIDIGGTGIKGAPVDTSTGELLAKKFRLDTPQPATPKGVINTVSEIATHFKWKDRIGCGFPAAIKNETVMTASNIDKKWLGLNAGKKISKTLNCPTHLINDVDAAGLAEVKFGQGKNVAGTVLMAAFGTGIGTALFTDGHLIMNTELGQILINGKIGEKYASNAVRKKEGLSWKQYGKRLNEYLQNIESLLWPDLIILGGGVSKNSDHFFKYLDLNAKIVPAKFKNNAGIIGAALSAQNLEKSKKSHSSKK